MPRQMAAIFTCHRHIPLTLQCRKRVACSKYITKCSKQSNVLIAILQSFYRLVAIVRGLVSLVHELPFTVGIWSMFLFTILLDTKCYTRYNVTEYKGDVT